MTVAKLIEMLEHSDINLNAKVFIVQYYPDAGEPTHITGMISDKEQIILTDEEL